MYIRGFFFFLEPANCIEKTQPTEATTDSSKGRAENQQNSDCKKENENWANRWAITLLFLGMKEIKEKVTI